MESGLTGIYPIEIQAGNDPDKIRPGKGPKAIEQELAQVPWMPEQGGYIGFLLTLILQ